MTAALTGVSDDRFRSEVRAWLREQVVGEFAELRGHGGPGDEEVGFETRVRWEQLLGEAGWIGLGWPVARGGRNASVSQQIIFAEEYTRAEAPERVNHMGENLLAPTLIEFGTDAQCDRFLPARPWGSGKHFNNRISKYHHLVRTYLDIVRLVQEQL